jgi:hypothetical protein
MYFSLLFFGEAHADTCNSVSNEDHCNRGEEVKEKNAVTAAVSGAVTITCLDMVIAVLN